MSALRAKWEGLVGRLGRDSSTETDALFADLERRYSEAKRAYHGLVHIGHCLAELENVRDLADDADAVELALWYHDAIYDPRAADNEAQSAALFLAQAATLGLDNDRRAKIAAMIEATAHDEDRVADSDTALLIDIDLSVLGQAGDIFDRYEEGIRSEYAWVEPTRFRAGRRAVLKGFLDRQAIFKTAAFRDRYEVAARANLERALAKLEPAT